MNQNSFFCVLLARRKVSLASLCVLCIHSRLQVYIFHSNFFTAGIHCSAVLMATFGAAATANTNPNKSFEVSYDWEVALLGVYFSSLLVYWVSELLIAN